MHQLFIHLYYLIAKNKIISIAIALGVLLTSFLFASKINFEEDINQIIPKNEKSDLTAKVLKQLNFSDKIIVIIENTSTQNDFQLSETADVFLEKINPLTKYINSIQGKVNDNEISETFEFVNRNLPLFLDSKDYESIQSKLHKDSISQKIQDNYISLTSPTSLVTKEFIKKDPLGLTFLGLQKLNALNISKDFRLENNYVVTKDGKNLLLFIDPKYKSNDTKNNETFVNQLNLIKEEINKNFKGKTEMSYFGSPVIAVANAQQIKKDIQNTVIISISVLLILLIYYFRNFFIPIIVFLPTVFAIFIGLVILYLVKDKVSAISLSVGAILIGITIDYALHILTHYKHNNNIEELYKEITKPIILSSVTTAVSFLCLVFVRSEALKDLGLFAAICVIFSAIFALIIIPQLYHPKVEKEDRKHNFIDKIGGYPYEKNKFLIIGCTLIIVGSLFGFRHVGFNNNIGDLNYIPDELKLSEKKLEKLSDITSKSIYTISYGNSENEALEKNSKLSEFLEREKKEGKILSYNSIGNMVLSEKDQLEKIKVWNQFWDQEKKDNTLSLVIKEGQQFGFNESAFEGIHQSIHKGYSPLSLEDYKKIKALQISEFLNSENGFHTITNIVKIDEEQRNNFIKDTERESDVIAIDRQQMNENFLGLLKRDFNTLINYSLFAIIFTIIIFFRNFELTILTMFPIVLTGVVTAGILYFLGLELNIFSTVVCTLVFGVGDDFSIFLTQAMQKENTTGKNELPTYRTSIILAVFTTILSIGSLVFAKHPALHSLALVALIGMFSVIVITSTLYPFWFRFFITNRTKKGLSPLTIGLLIRSLFSFAYYGFGCIIFTIIGKLFINHKKPQFRFTKAISKFLTSVLYTIPSVKKKVIFNSQEDFSKPAIIIANHTSFLDTLAIAMVNHKVIYLVNDWVYHSPIFGSVVRALGFLPASQGLENYKSLLEDKIKQGYSLVIFPEGERSYTNEIKRFHKGAFYLAEEFKLDILPIYIHGTSEVLPKGDFIIYDGSITVKVGERISYTDDSFGSTYSEKCKKINMHFRKEFSKLRTELEPPSYFKQSLLRSYLYKDQGIYNQVKKDINDNLITYNEVNKYIPNKATILNIADDYGQVSTLLSLYQPERKIYTIINNQEKYNVAQHTHWVKNRKLIYFNPISDFNKEVDVLIISTENVDFSNISIIPEIIITINIVNSKFELGNYKIIYSSGNTTIYKLKEV